MSSLWRTAFMFDAIDGNLSQVEEFLLQRTATIRRAAGDADIRIGIADRQPQASNQSDEAYDIDNWRTVDAALEVTFTASRLRELPRIVAAIRPNLEDIAAPASSEVMAGPIFHMVPPRQGNTFLSLAFQRYPGTSSEDFRSWWKHQHAPIAIPVLGKAMLAYDQVHIDAEVTQNIATAFGVAPVNYDAYDNLTWHDRHGFIQSISNLEGMAQLAADEQKRIDNGTRRHSLMRVIG